jgi:5-methylcytosine-specific restriction protein A
MVDKRQADAKRWQRTQRTPEIAAARKLYDTRWWRRESKVFLARNPLCKHCDELGLVTAATEVDHIIPHRGNAKLFRDRKNWQALCASCHGRKTASETLNKQG